jgi:hypothetical protein
MVLGGETVWKKSLHVSVMGGSAFCTHGNSSLLAHFENWLGPN